MLERLDSTLRLPPPREKTLGPDRSARDEPIGAERSRENPPRDDVDRETRESPSEALLRERLKPPESTEERDDWTESPPRLDELTREAARGTYCPAERPWSAREVRADEELVAPNGVKPSLEPRSSERERLRLDRLPPPPPSPDGAERGALRSTDGKWQHLDVSGDSAP
jgi:hypothetical protein